MKGERRKKFSGEKKSKTKAKQGLKWEGANADKGKGDFEWGRSQAENNTIQPPRGLVVTTLSTVLCTVLCTCSFR